MDLLDEMGDSKLFHVSSSFYKMKGKVSWTEITEWNKSKNLCSSFQNI